MQELQHYISELPLSVSSPHIKAILICLFVVNMTKKIHTKPMDAYKELDDTGRRLVNKLITGLHEQKLDQETRLTINRTINRTRRDQSYRQKIHERVSHLLQGEICCTEKRAKSTDNRGWEAAGGGMEGP